MSTAHCKPTIFVISNVFSITLSLKATFNCDLFSVILLILDCSAYKIQFAYIIILSATSINFGGSILATGVDIILFFRLLTWEDGCYDDPKLRGSTDSILDHTCFNGSNKILSSDCGSCGNDGIAGEYSIGQVVADLAGVHYRLGEG